jgi:hypothetical protein
MPISAKCKNCGRGYSVKDEHAGKKFRCQECQAAVSVPVPKPKADDYAADDWEADDFSTQDYEDYDDYGDYESDQPPPPPRRAVKKKKPAAKKKPAKKRSSASSESGGIGAMIGKIGGGLFVGLFVMSLVVRLLTGGGLDFGGSWESYTTPDGNITVQMPGKVKSVPVKQMAPGGQSFGAERRSFACIIVIEPMPAELNGLTDEEMYQAMEIGSRFLGATNVKRSTTNGHPSVSFEKAATDGIKASGVAFLHKGKVYTLNFAYKGSKGSNEEKFFGSVKFN